MDNPNLAKIAQSILDAPSFDSLEDYFAFVTNVAGDLNEEQIEALNLMVLHEREAQLAELDREITQNKAMLEIMSGFPEGTEFAEACRIKAKQGHTLAQRFVDHWNSRAHRVHQVLFEAAVRPE